MPSTKPRKVNVNARPRMSYTYQTGGAGLPRSWEEINREVGERREK